MGRLILSLSLPGMASMITLALYNIIDTFWVARLGHEAIAALTIILPWNILVIAIGVGSGIGISALTSRRFGEGNIEATNHAAGQVFPLSGLFGGIFLASAVFLPHPMLTFFGATQDIMDYASQYLRIIGFGVPFLLLSIMNNNLLRGSGDALRPMIFMIAGAVVNIILDPLLIFGIGPFPELGVQGAALATVIAQLISAGLNFSYIIARRSAYRIELHHLKPGLSILFDIYRVGFPSIIMQITESVTFILLNNVLSTFGSLAIAAAGLVIRVADLAFMPAFGVSQGLLPIVGFNFGAHLWKRVWVAVKLASGGLALFMAITMVVLEIFAPEIIGIFSDDPELITIAVPAMRIVMTSLFLIGPAILFVTTFQGLSKGKDALILSQTRQLVFLVPLLFLLPRIWGATGIWLSIPFSDALGFLVAGLWLFREYKMQQKAGNWSDIPARTS
ncbi:MAG: MATE family efflux transporter [Dehalococcoidales bacterium]|nr:MATE family efflux transporter [Dehalococcoidales bacterium]